MRIPRPLHLFSTCNWYQKTYLSSVNFNLISNVCELFCNSLVRCLAIEDTRVVYDYAVGGLSGSGNRVEQQWSIENEVFLCSRAICRNSWTCSLFLAFANRQIQETVFSTAKCMRAARSTLISIVNPPVVPWVFRLFTKEYERESRF